MFFRIDPARLITKCLLCGFAAITVLVCIGALFPNKGDAAPQSSNALPTKKAEQPMPGENDGIQTVSTDRRITALKSTKVEWKLRFDGCGHYITLKSQGDITGMDKEEAKAAYSDYSAELFTSAYVSLVKDSGGCCPEHYVMLSGADGDTLEVYKRNTQTLENEHITSIDISPDRFAEDTAALQTGGLLFNSLQEINEYIESVE